MKKITHQQIKNEFDCQLKSLINEIDIFPWDNIKAYSHWLAQSYFLVRHTTRFAAYTASQMDFAYEKLHKHLLKHLREEMGHELLAANDLKSLGFAPESFSPTLQAQLLIQGQYFIIGKHPLAHFGFIWVLEALAGERGVALVARIKDSFGDGACSFLEVHAEVDVDHAAEIYQVIKTFDEDQMAPVLDAISQTSYLYSQMLQQIKQDALQSKRAA